MRKTVRALARTSMGIIAVRKPGETQWGYIEAVVPADASDWKEAIAVAFERATSIPVDASQFRRIDSKVNHHGGSDARYRVIYCEAIISDSRVLSTIRSRGEDGHEVEEVTYWKAANGMSLRKEVREFLRKHDMLGPRP